MITQPLDLVSKLRAPPRDFDVFFWANAALIVLFFALLGSRFVLAPGMAVQVGEPAALELPQVDSAMLGAASVVVSYRRDEMLLFEGGIYNIREFRPELEKYVKRHPDAVLLVRVDKQVSAQGLARLFNMAKTAGFVRVHWAMESDGSDAARPGSSSKR